MSQQSQFWERYETMIGCLADLAPLKYRKGSDSAKDIRQ